jgi:hypothetical protein
MNHETKCYLRKLDNIDRPIFIIGSGRSGTTLLYKLLAGHNDVCWFSNYTRKFPKIYFLSWLVELYQLPYLSRSIKEKKWFPRPVEGHTIWDKFHPVENSSGEPPFSEADIKNVHKENMNLFISNIIRYSGKLRFLNKNTRNTRRIPYLYKLFPDAFFIHTIRDGRAVTNSLLNVKFWSNLSIWWADGKTVEELENIGQNQTVLAAKMWKHEVEQALKDKNCLPVDQYVEIHYEELVKKPIEEMKRLTDSCDLHWSHKFRSHIESFKIEDRNFKWSNQLSLGEIEKISEVIEPLQKKLGYI